MLRVAVVIALGLSASALAAGPRVRLDLAAGLPFSPAELAAEVALRVEVATGERRPGELAARVEPQGEGWVAVRIGAKERAVSVGARTGEAAARRVALALADLALAEASPAEGATTPRATTTTTPAPIWAARLVLRIAPEVGVGTNGDQVHAAGAVAATVALWRWLRAFAELGAGGGPAARSGAIALALVEVPIRIGLGARVWRWIELRAGLLVEPYRLIADGARSDDGALWGGTVSAEGWVPLARRVALALSIGADLFATRVAWTLAGQPALATERAGFWAGAGLAVEAWR